MENNSDPNILSKNFINSLNFNTEQKKPIKYVVVCGGTISGIGKGTCISSIGMLFQSLGLKVTCIKIDPYFNLDAGTMSPYEHGEVFVLDDGGEVDLDLGNYERVLRIKLTRAHNITSGKVFNTVIQKERKGEYLGKTVQMIPHVTDQILEMIQDASRIPVVEGDNSLPDVCLIEIGGTVGDLESNIFFEAIRQLSLNVNSNDIAIILLGYFPVLSGGIAKCKPAQHSIKDLKSMGIFPNFMLARCTIELSENMKRKTAFYANMALENIITVYDVDIYYDVTMLLAYNNLQLKLAKHLDLPVRNFKVQKWIRLGEHIRSLNKLEKELVIAIVGKYADGTDPYYSVMKSLKDAAYSAYVKLKEIWIDSTVIDDDYVRIVDNKSVEEQRKEFWENIRLADGILVPGGKVKINIRLWSKRN
jgi:CTP synthase